MESKLKKRDTCDYCDYLGSWSEKAMCFGACKLSGLSFILHLIFTCVFMNASMARHVSNHMSQLHSSLARFNNA